MVIQPVTATLVPPMAWVAFQTTAVRYFIKVDYLNILGPVCALVSLQATDAMPRMRLGAGDIPSHIWKVIGAALIAAALSDALIVAAQMMDASYLQPWIISIYSSTMLLIVGRLSLPTALENETTQTDDTTELPVSDQDIEIIGKLDALMTTQQLYLNPDLTLPLLSRRFLVPAKQLSSAINQSTGGNVSRYINVARIKAAQDRLLAGKNITNAMLSSGFNTKSNFNREFLRVSGKNPSQWLASQASANTKTTEP
ncbi:AraC-type DNA-binding protein [Aliiroseovarius halocynthiae]|uniref:AraC family transcriptional regulator n=1 Tax=Aliiroseovarius halocynthiae TaxID=985055 RepID=A0A545SNC6_9RHOB|nr:helix-turn-helix domain-containing protein [Aliiroseovarius halocynthiae]TQV66457.1 AraC family transcriptional regulator [Aliiroseovarius halocynthiae]SMR83607.1 AraC-type DNA-binding protein [Aliiroseovarius halocynthiae]